MSGLWLVAFVTLWALVILLGFLVLGTLRRLIPLIARAEESLAAAAVDPSPGGLEPGTVVPPFSARQPGARTFTEADLTGSDSIVLFVSSACRSCERFVADLKKAHAPGLGARLVVITDEENQARELAASPGVVVLVQENRALARNFESRATPHAFVLDDSRRVLATGTPNDWARLRQLIATAKRGGGTKADVAAAAVGSDRKGSADGRIS